MGEGFIADRSTLARRGRRLEYFTIGWNLLEGLVAVIAGLAAGSISLIGFGIDSFIEVTSGAAVLWRISVDTDIARRERNERLTLRFVGVCFIVLAAYVAYEAIGHLIRREEPEHSLPGIILACVSLMVMPLLSRAKRRVGTVDRARKRSNARGCEANRFLYVPLRHSSLWSASERSVSYVVGRSDRCARHGADYRKRRVRGPSR
jgi:hypothetical protein